MKNNKEHWGDGRGAFSAVSRTPRWKSGPSDVIAMMSLQKAIPSLSEERDLYWYKDGWLQEDLSETQTSLYSKLGDSAGVRKYNCSRQGTPEVILSHTEQQ